jgi:hypothetical protein
VGFIELIVLGDAPVLSRWPSCDKAKIPQKQCLEIFNMCGTNRFFELHILIKPYTASLAAAAVLDSATV